MFNRKDLRDLDGFNRKLADRFVSNARQGLSDAVVKCHTWNAASKLDEKATRNNILRRMNRRDPFQPTTRSCVVSDTAKAEEQEEEQEGTESSVETGQQMKASIGHFTNILCNDESASSSISASQYLPLSVHNRLLPQPNSLIATI